MAAVVDYGVADPTVGFYGLYNPFFIRITRTGSTVFKLKYRINITVPDTNIDITKDIDPIDEVSIVNPVEPLKGQFFESQLVGNNGVSEVPLDTSGGCADKSFNRVRIKVGEVYATAADLPATFLGYTSDNTIWMYNGFDNVPTTNLYSNFRPSNTYIPNLKIPLVNKNIKLLSDDIAFISLPSEINIPIIEEGGGGLITIHKLYFTHYDKEGGVLNSGNFGLVGRYGTTRGYWTVGYGTTNIFYPENWAYSKYYAEYIDAESKLYDTESFNVYKQECDPKYNRFRLRWFNRYSAFEYFNFTKKSKFDINVEKGKEVRTSGINFDATTFGSIKYPAIPELREVGKSATTTYTLNSDYLTEEEVESLKDLYISPNVVMFDKDNNIYPVIVQERSFEVTDIRDGLIKVSVKVRLANDNKVILQ